MPAPVDKYSHLSMPELLDPASGFFAQLLQCHNNSSLSAFFEYGGDEASSLTAIKSFADEAAARGIPPTLWFSISHSNYYNNGEANSPLIRASRRPYRAAGFRALLEIGASPWPSHISRDSVNLANSKPAACYSNPETLAEAIFPRESSYAPTQSAAHFLLAQGLARLGDVPADIRVKFLEELPRAYAESTRKSSSTSSGVMGASDKAAKVCAQLISKNAAALRAAALAHAPKLVASIETLISDAAARLAIKSKKNAADFDPEALRKSLTSEQKQRLRILIHLCNEFPDDSEAWAAVASASPWIAKMPQCLCVKLGSGGSVAMAAMANASLAGLQALDSLGANIWLAAAQSGQGNAVRWAGSMISRSRYGDKTFMERRDRALPIVERLLAYGAFLDGAPDPISHAAERAREAIASGKQSREYGYDEKLLETMRAGIERIVLAELLAGRDEQADSSGGESSAPPARSSRRL